MQPVIIKRERVNLTPGAAASARVRPEREAHRAQVRTVVDQGVVVALEVTCGCGEVSLVELRFPESAEVQP
jgi:hypothetical protein